MPAKNRRIQKGKRTRDRKGSSPTNSPKKSVKEPEPPIETKPPIEPESADQTSKLVAKQLDDNGSAKMVDGGDTLEVKGKGRFYLFKKDEKAALAKQEQYLWSPNVEVSLDIQVNEVLTAAKRFINVGGVTNHFTEVSNNSNGRNYSIVGRFDRKGVGFKKETVHGAYDEYETDPMQLQLDKWYTLKYKQTVANDAKSILLEGWINGKQIGPFEDTGDMPMTEDIALTTKIVQSGDKAALYSPIKSPKQVWTAGAYSGLYIRLTGTVSTKIKNVTIKES